MAVAARIAALITASNTASSDEERDERFARSELASEVFRHEFTPAQRLMLLDAAERSNLVFVTLASGQWEQAVRALRGFVARTVPQEQWEEYRELIVALNLLTANRLEGEVISIDHNKTPVAAAAA
jgi:hypothetical protein